MTPSVPGRDGGARQHHEVGVAARDIERIVRLQRNEHRAAAALVDEVEAVIEELAEQREPRVERRRQAFVRRDVGKMDVVAVHRDAERLERGIAHDARRFKVGHGRRRGRLAARPEQRWPPAPRRRRRGGIAIAERVRGRLGVLHHDARLIFGVEGRLEGLVDRRDDGEIGHRVCGAGALQRRQDRGRIAQRLVDQQVGNRAQARVEDQRVGIVRRIVVGRRRHRRRRPGTVGIEQRAVGRPDTTGSSSSGNWLSAAPHCSWPGSRWL